MPLSKYEQRWVPKVESALGEPILRCVAMNAAGMHALMWTDSLSPVFRQYVLVNGQPYSRLPRTMYLILTPTRVLITQTRTTFIHGKAPELAAPLLVLVRGDAEITATPGADGAWAFRLRSRASTAELELELLPFMGIATELAVQLRDFSLAPNTVASTPSTPTEAPSIEAATPSMATATSEMSPSRRRVVRAYQRSTNWAVACGVLLLVVIFGMGSYTFYEYRSGTPTTATVVHCYGVKSKKCDATWNIDGQSYTGPVAGPLDDSYQVGSSHLVRVRDGKGYTMASVRAWLVRAGYIAGLIVLVIIVRAFMKRRFLGVR
jgi:hypothetical protein